MARAAPRRRRDYETWIQVFAPLLRSEYVSDEGHRKLQVKITAACLSLLFALSASAQPPVRAKLVGQRVIAIYPRAPILICRYAGPDAKYEIVASSEKCAPYLTLSRM